MSESYGNSPVSTTTTGASPENVADVVACLIRLPAEVRVNIYRQLFKEGEIRLRVTTDLKLHCRDTNKVTSVLRVGRLLRAEAMPICHATALFEGSENDFELLDDFKKSYGGLADRSRFAKVVMHKHVWPSEDLETGGLVNWIGQPTMLRDLTCHIVGSMRPRDDRPPAIRPTYNQLYQSDSKRRAELGDLMYHWSWSPDKWRAIEDILRVASIRVRSGHFAPKVVVYCTIAGVILENHSPVSPFQSAP
jgi:hypothetical protein